MKRLFLVLSAVVLMGAADPNQCSNQQECNDYIRLLKSDRDTYIRQIDQLRLHLDSLQQFIQAMVKHDQDLKEYWKKYTGGK